MTVPAEPTALVTNDAVVLGMLALILGAVFWASNLKSAGVQKFFSIIPALLLCYFLPSLLTTFGIVDPETSQLLLAADALITDYSSVMFDFSVTGKPMYFLVPDLDHYRGKLRGFYFDLAARAPGPLVRTQGDLVAALAEDGHEERYAARYAAWRAQFNTRDDGRAAERVVARILDQGYVTR